MEHGKWEVGLNEISYPRGYKKRSFQNTLRLDLEDIPFPVKHYETVFDLHKNVPRFHEPSIKENFVCVFSNYIKKYQKQNEELFNSYRGENSIMFDENLVSYFAARVYNGTDDLAEIIMNPASCHSSTVNLSTKDNFNFTQILSNQIWLEILVCDY